MNEVYLVHKVIDWCNESSKTVIGVATSMTSIITICKEQACKEGYTIDEKQAWKLQTYSQTQGYSGEGEFQFETVETDTLL